MDIYVKDVSIYKNEEEFKKDYSLVFDFRKEKVDRMRFPKDKYLSLGAGILLHEALKERGIETYKVLTEKNGRPYLEGLSDNIKFSLSHSGNIALCLVTDKDDDKQKRGIAPNVGCDVELIKEADMKIAKRFFNQKEYEYLSCIKDGKERNRAFYKIWTLKESFVKALGDGLQIDLNSFYFDFIGDKIEIHQNISDNEYIFGIIKGDPEYVMSYCIEV